MNIESDRATARVQRVRAQRALADADAARTRLAEARERAEALLHRAGGEEAAPADGEPQPPPEERLRRRMRQIEDRMQETDTRMRHAEDEVARVEEERRDVAPAPDPPPRRR